MFGFEIFVSKTFLWFYLTYIGMNPVGFVEYLRGTEFPPEVRVESGFTLSNKVLPLTADWADPEAVRQQARMLRLVGVREVQVYLLRWNEVDSDGNPFPIHDQVNRQIMEILKKEGLGVHAEFFTHGVGIFESREKNSTSCFPSEVPANQVAPLELVVRQGLIPEFQKYVTGVVRQYPQVKSWGFLNEVDQVNRWNFADLIVLQNAYYEAVKGANPYTLVGAAGPTFPELLASPGKLHPEVFKSLGYYRDDVGFLQRSPETPMTKGLDRFWGIKYPEVYEKWRRFYAETLYDFVQIHQLGVSFWPNADWVDGSYDENGDFNPDSLKWQLVRVGVKNVREMVGPKLITSQVDINSYEYEVEYGSPEYWRRVCQNFKEAASGKYGYDFLDIYHMRENHHVLPDGEVWRVVDTCLFDIVTEPTDLYYEIGNIYSDYPSRLYKQLSSSAWRKRR